MSEEAGMETLVELLDDEYAREILAAASREPLSADQLCDRIDASPPTVYRRLDRLREHDLLTAQRRIDPDGHHHEVFATRLERVGIELRDGEYSVEVQRRDPDAADRFTELFEGLR